MVSYCYGKLAVFHSNMKPFNKLHGILKNPYLEVEGFHEYEKPDENSKEKYKTYCGT